MKHLNLLIILILASCSKPAPHFAVSADLPQIGTQSLSVVYSTDDGNRHSIPITAVNGKFEFSGESETPSLIEIYTSKGQLYAALLAQNGDNISLTGTPGEFKAQGNTLAQPLLDYKQGDDTAGLPLLVRQAIQSLYLTAPLHTEAKFPPLEVWVQRDSVETFPPEGIWVFTSSEKQRTPQLLDTLRHYAKSKDLNVRDIYIATDLWAWQVLTRHDSATWTQALSIDAPAKLPAILTTTPLLLQVDSLGTILRTQPL